MSQIRLPNSGAIQRDNLPPSRQARLPNFPLPVARLARLAVDHQFQGQQLGETLLMDALYRCYRNRLAPSHRYPTLLGVASKGPFGYLTAPVSLLPCS